MFSDQDCSLQNVHSVRKFSVVLNSPIKKRIQLLLLACSGMKENKSVNHRHLVQNMGGMAKGFSRFYITKIPIKLSKICELLELH